MTEYILQPRYNTAAGAAANNRVLAVGEEGYETDTRRTKRGDGVTPYNDLPYEDESYATADELAEVTGAVKAGQAWWDHVMAPPAADDIPTSVTVSTSGLVVGGTTITPTADYFGDPHFRYDGCADVVSAGTDLVGPVHPSGGATYTIIPEYVTPVTDKVDTWFKTNSAGTVVGLRITINGRWLTLPVQWFPSTPNTLHSVRLPFPSAKVRTIRIECINAASFGGVTVPSGMTVTRPGQEVRKRMVVVGDSLTKGANGNSTTNPATNGCSQFETFPHYVAKMMGCDSVLNLGVGGTGHVDDNDGADSTFGERIADVLKASPHIVLVAGSINDFAATQAQILDAATNTLLALSDIPIVEVCGPQDDQTGTGTSTRAQINEAVKGAALKAGRRFNDMLGVLTSADKNAADATHPSVLGSQKLARAFYASLDRARIDEDVAAAVAGRSSVDVTLSASPSNAATVSATVTFTATLSTHRAGKVYFYADNQAIGSGTVTAAVATFATSALAVGAHTIVARFVPTNPLLVKAVTSNALAYNISSNLGFVDTFTRADGPVGATENGKVYSTSGSGAWVVSGNKLANPTTSGTGYCAAEAGTPNGTLQVTIGGTGGVGLGALLIMRYIDGSNGLILTRSSNEIQFNKRVANVSTQVAISTGSSVWIAGDVISVEISGDTFTVKKNGVNVPGLVGISCSDFNTATKHGVGVTSSGAGATFDDLSFVA